MKGYKKLLALLVRDPLPLSCHALYDIDEDVDPLLLRGDEVWLYCTTKPQPILEKAIEPWAKELGLKSKAIAFRHYGIAGSYVRVHIQEMTEKELAKKVLAMLILAAKLGPNPILYQNKLRLKYAMEQISSWDLKATKVISNKKVNSKRGLENIVVKSKLLDNKLLVCTDPEFIGVIPEDSHGCALGELNPFEYGIGIINTRGLCLIEIRDDCPYQTI